MLFTEQNLMTVWGAKLTKPQHPTALEVFASPPEWSHLRKTRVIKQYLVSTFLLWGRYMISVAVYHEYQMFQMVLNPQVVLLPFYWYVLGGWCDGENTTPIVRGGGNLPAGLQCMAVQVVPAQGCPLKGREGAWNLACVFGYINTQPSSILFFFFYP